MAEKTCSMCLYFMRGHDSCELDPVGKKYCRPYRNPMAEPCDAAQFMRGSRAIVIRVCEACKRNFTVAKSHSGKREKRRCARCNSREAAFKREKKKREVMNVVGRAE